MWLNLLKTWMVEIPILWLFLRTHDRLLMIVWLGILINTSTWTFLTYYYALFGANIYYLECLVAVAESLWIRSLWQLSWSKSVLMGFLTNALSFGLGWWGLI